MDEILKNIYDELKSNSLTTSEFDAWKNNFNNKEEVQINVHSYLTEKGLTSSNFNTWQGNVLESSSIQDLPKNESVVSNNESEILKEIEPKQLTQEELSTAQKQADEAYLAKNGQEAFNKLLEAREFNKINPDTIKQTPTIVKDKFSITERRGVDEKFGNQKPEEIEIKGFDNEKMINLNTKLFEAATLTNEEMIDITTDIQRRKDGELNLFEKIKAHFIPSSKTQGLKANVFEQQHKAVRQKVFQKQSDFFKSLDPDEIPLFKSFISKRNDKLTDDFIVADSFNEKLTGVIGPKIKELNSISIQLNELAKKENFTQEDENIFNQLVATHEENEKSLQPLLKQYDINRNTLINNEDDLLSFNDELNLAKRDYDQFKIGGLSPFNIIKGFQFMGENVAAFGSGLLIDAIEFRMTGFTNANTSLDKAQVAMDDYSKNISERKEKHEESIPLKRQFSDVNNSSDFGEYAFSLIEDQIPILTTIGLTGGAGLGIVATSSAGDRFGQLLLEQDSDGNEYSRDQVRADALMYGVGEYVGERITLGILKNYKKALKTANKTTFKVGLNKAISNTYKGISTANREGLSEVYTKYIQGIADASILDDNTQILSSPIEEYISGVVMGGGIHIGSEGIKIGNAFGNFAIGQYSKSQDRKKVSDNVAKILEYENLKEKGGFSKDINELYQSKIQSLINENNKIVDISIKDIQGLDPKKLTKITAINSKLKSLQIALSKNKDEEIKKTLLADVTELSNEKEELLESKEGPISEIKKENINKKPPVAENATSEIESKKNISNVLQTDDKKENISFTTGNKPDASFNYETKPKDLNLDKIKFNIDKNNSKGNNLFTVTSTDDKNDLGIVVVNSYGLINQRGYKEYETDGIFLSDNSLKGKGVGIRTTIQMVEEARRRGIEIHSSSISISKDGEKLWDRLVDQGYANKLSDIQSLDFEENIPHYVTTLNQKPQLKKKDINLKKEIIDDEKVKSFTLGTTKKSKKYNAVFKDGKLIITNDKGKIPSKVTIRKIHKQYAEDFDFTNGKKAIQGEAQNPEFHKDVTENSQNPSEIARTISEIDNEGFIASKLDFKIKVISENIGLIGRQSFIDNSDVNNITQGLAKSYLRKDGKPIDNIAQELSEDYNIEITEQDIVDFIINNPNGPQGVVSSIKNENINPLKQRFTELTGLPATDNFLNKAIEAENKQNENFSIVDILTDEELLNLQNEKEQSEQKIKESQTSSEIKTTIEDITKNGERSNIQKESKVTSKKDQLAPNGKKSILFLDILKIKGVNSKEQALNIYNKTKSESFKKWFGNSKIVDANGEPLVLFHATLNDFNQFSDFNQRHKTGFHFGTFKTAFERLEFNFETLGDSKDPTAKERIKREIKDTTHNILPVFLKADKIVNSKDEVDHEKYGHWTDIIEDLRKKSDFDGIKYINELEGKGDTSYIVFDGGQIKSVFNSGEFNSNSKNIFDDGNSLDNLSNIKINDVNTRKKISTLFGDMLIDLDKIDKNITKSSKENLNSAITGISLAAAKTVIKAMKIAVRTAKTGAEIIEAGLRALRKTKWYQNLTVKNQKKSEKQLSKFISQPLSEIAFTIKETEKRRSDIRASKLKETSRKLREKYKDEKNYKREVIKSVREKLDAEDIRYTTKTQFTSLLSKFNNATIKSIPKLIQAVETEIVIVKNKRALEKLNDLLRKPNKYLQKDKSGRTKAKIIDNKTRKQVKFITEWSNRNSTEIESEIYRLQGETTNTKTEQIGLDISKRIALGRESKQTAKSYKKTDKLHLYYFIEALKNNTISFSEMTDLINEGKSILQEQVKIEADRLREIGIEGATSTTHKLSGLLKSEIQKIQFDRKFKIFDNITKGTRERINQWFIKSTTNSFEFLIGYIDQLNNHGKGNMYKRFYSGKSGIIQLDANYLQEKRNIAKSLQDKINNILGKKYKNIFSDYFHAKEINKLGKTGIFTLDEELNRRKISETLSLNQALYVHLVSKMTVQREQLENQGWDDKAMIQLESFLGEKYIKMSDYITNYLKERYGRYNRVHLELLRTDLGFEEGYFPTKYDGIDLKSEVNLGGNTFSMAGVMPGNIITKVKNTNRLDITQNAFDVLAQYMDSMERFYHYGRFTKDMNSLLTNKEFKNNVLSYDKQAYSDLVKITKAVIGDKSEFDVGKVETGLYGLNAAVASGYILWKGYTALKQFLSMPAYTEFANMFKVGNKKIPFFHKTYFGMKMAGQMNPLSIVRNFKILRKKSIHFNERMKRGSVGDEFIEALLSSSKNKSLLTKLFIWFTKKGISPNKLIDAVTISTGGMVYYNQQFKKYKRNGLSEKEADAQAIRDFEVGFKITQQSSDLANLAPIQIRKGALTSLFVPFKNAQMSYFRRIMANKNNIIKRYNRSKKGFIRGGFSEVKSSIKAFNNIIKNADTYNELTNILMYTHGLPLLWQYVASGLPGILTAWDDEDTEELKRAAFIGPIDGLFIINDLSKFSYNSLILKKRWTLEQSILLGEIEKTFKSIAKASKDEGFFNDEVLEEITKAWLKTHSINTETYVNIYKGIENLILNEEATQKNIMKILNAPKELQQGNINKPEKNKEIKIPLNELN